MDHGVPCRESFYAQHELNKHLLSDIDVALHILRVQLFLENATMDDAEIFASGPNGHGVPCRDSFDAQQELNRHLLSDIDVGLHILRV